MNEKNSKSLKFYFQLTLILVFVLSGCSGGDAVQQSTTVPLPTRTDDIALELNNNGYLSPCDLVTVLEMEEIFQESPLFFSEENGACVIRNQWDTRSIWFMVVQGEQSLRAMRWHTMHLVENWPAEDLKKLAEDIIADENNQSIDTLQLARLPLYEELEYRWERIFTFGEISYWIINPRAFKGIFDVVEGDIFYQVGYSGFLAAQIQPKLEDLSTNIFSRLPERFMLDFDFSIVEEGNEVDSEIEEKPQIVDLNVSSREIYFGSLCGDETTTIQVIVENFELVDNVFLVYRLRSSGENNDNWTTLFMNKLSPENWEITINAENSFNAYQLVDGAQVEYSIATIYAVNKVDRSDTYQDIVVYQCKQ